jgi:hypothetical protein
MNVRLHPHARGRLAERGATEAEVIATVETGERFPAKWGRTGFRRNFAFNGKWRDRQHATKQIEAYAVEEEGWLVITIIVRYF